MGTFLFVFLCFEFSLGEMGNALSDLKCTLQIVSFVYFFFYSINTNLEKK